MTTVRIEDNCPRCKKITNHGLEIQMWDQSIVQKCYNCELEREASLNWSPWMVREEYLHEWKEDEPETKDVSQAGNIVCSPYCTCWRDGGQWMCIYGSYPHSDCMKVNLKLLNLLKGVK